MRPDANVHNYVHNLLSKEALFFWIRVSDKCIFDSEANATNDQKNGCFGRD